MSIELHRLMASRRRVPPSRCVPIVNTDGGTERAPLVMGGQGRFPTSLYEAALVLAAVGLAVLVLVGLGVVSWAMGGGR